MYKIIVAGDSKTGKSAAVEEMLTGVKPSQYTPTLGVEVHPVSVDTTNAQRISLWDTAGDGRYLGLREGYYINSDGAIVFFDSKRPDTFQNAFKWMESILRVCTIPVFLFDPRKEKSPVELRMPPNVSCNEKIPIFIGTDFAAVLKELTGEIDNQKNLPKL